MFRNLPDLTRYGSLRQLSRLMLLLPLLLAGCVKNEFRLVFQLPLSVNSTYRLSYYASDPRGGIQVESAVAVAAGKGEMTGITRYPTLGIISSGQSDIPAAIFYAERGDKIKLSGDGADPLDWTIDGNKTNVRLTEWRLANRDLISKARLAGADSKDSSARKALNKAVAEFITANTDSKASPLILTAYFDASAQPAEYRRLSRMLDEAGTLDPMVALMARQDVLTASAAVDDPSGLPLRDFPLRNRDGFTDTLRLGGSASPALIYFWRKNEPAHSEIIDTLKHLAAWRPDSLSMQIADIALTADSIVWAGAVRRDSLRHTLRSFTPRELADTMAISLGVRSTPWFIVASGKRVLYTGGDISEASRKFRTLKPKSKD